MAGVIVKSGAVASRLVAMLAEREAIDESTIVIEIPPGRETDILFSGLEQRSRGKGKRLKPWQKSKFG